MDLDLPFSLSYSMGATINFYSSLAVLAVVTWQVLIVAIPMLYVVIRMQVRKRFIFKQCSFFFKYEHKTTTELYYMDQTIP